MADEAQVIAKPGTTPAGTTDYTAQNTNTEAAHNGIDRTAPYGTSATAAALPVGGPVDVNGVLVSIETAVTLSGMSASTDYYVKLVAGSDASHYTPTLTTDFGTFDATKNARYSASGERILNWVLRGNGTDNVVCTRLIDAQKATAGTDQDLRKTATPEHAGMVLNSALSEIKSSTSDGSDSKAVAVAGGGGYASSRGASARAYGNEHATAPGRLDLFAGAVSGSSVNINTADDLSSSLAAQFDDASGMTLNRPFLPTSAPTSGYQTVSVGSQYVLPRGIWNITMGVFYVKQYISGSWRALAYYASGDSNSSLGIGVCSDGSNVEIDNTGANPVNVFYQKY